MSELPSLKTSLLCNCLIIRKLKEKLVLEYRRQQRKQQQRGQGQQERGRTETRGKPRNIEERKTQKKDKGNKKRENLDKF